MPHVGAVISSPLHFGAAFSFLPFGVIVMTQTQLDRMVAKATGEVLSSIRRRGFSIATFGIDLEPDQRPPQMVDWDELDRKRYELGTAR